MSTRKTYYQVLSVDPESSEADLKLAYRNLARRYHPDKNLDNPSAAAEKFKEVSTAYNTLSNPAKRMYYDLFGADDDGSLQVFSSSSVLSKFDDLEKPSHPVPSCRKRSRSRQYKTKPCPKRPI
jgi:DnaJ-class molecular chaperone